MYELYRIYIAGMAGRCKGQRDKDTVSSLQVMSSATKTSAPEATTKAYVSGVLDKMMPRQPTPEESSL